MGKSGNPAKAAEQEAAETETPAREYAPAADEHGTEDFDAFWAARKRTRRSTKIMGQLVTLPPSIPLQFEMEARRLERSKTDQDVQHLVGILFGPDALDGWIEAGLDAEQFAVLLAWAPGAITGSGMTLAEVADHIAASVAADTDTDEDESADPS